MLKKSIRRPVLLPLAAGVAALGTTLLSPGVASAHVTPQDGEAPAGAYFTTAFKVGHGCNGSATTKVELKVGEGVTSVKPQAVPGWTVTTTTRRLDPPVTMHGRQITETVDTVVWAAATPEAALPDSQLQMFWISMKLPEGKPGTKVTFPTVQTCVEGETRWVEQAQDGAAEPEHPAPVVVLTAATGDAHGSGDNHGSGGSHGSGETKDENAASSTGASAKDSDTGTTLGVIGIVVGSLGLVVGAAAFMRRKPASAS